MNNATNTDARNANKADILRAFNTTGAVTKTSIAKLLHVSPSAAAKLLREMRKEGLLRFCSANSCMPACFRLDFAKVDIELNVADIPNNY